MLALILTGLSSCREAILHDLGESEANRILTHLHSVEVDAHRERQANGNWSILVSDDQAPRALRTIQDARLIRETRPQRSSSPSMMASREEQRFQFERGLSREIESTLLTIGGVIEARVHLNLPPSDPLRAVLGASTNNTGSASVLLLCEANRRPEPAEVAALVAGASGVSADAVKVLVSEAAATAAVPEIAPPPVMEEFAVPRARTLSYEVALSLIIAGAGALYLSRQTPARARAARDEGRAEKIALGS